MKFDRSFYGIHPARPNRVAGSKGGSGLREGDARAAEARAAGTVSEPADGPASSLSGRAPFNQVPPEKRDQDGDEAVDEVEERKHENELGKVPERRTGRAHDEQSGAAEPRGNLPGAPVVHDAPHERSGFVRLRVRDHDRHAAPQLERGRSGHFPVPMEKTVVRFVPDCLLLRVGPLQFRRVDPDEAGFGAGGEIPRIGDDHPCEEDSQRPESDADDPPRCANGPLPRRFTVGIEVLENGRQSGIADCVHVAESSRSGVAGSKGGSGLREGALGRYETARRMAANQIAERNAAGSRSNAS